MYKVKWYAGNSLYEASGGASANSLFFETKNDHQLFLQFWNRFMADYAELIYYSFTEVSWAVIFKTKEKSIILKQYAQHHQESKKVKREKKLSHVGPIVSQAMRLLLSNYVVASNRNLGKNGSRVKRRFHKFGFIDEADYQNRIKMHDRLEQLYTQKLKKYRANEEYYDEAKEMEFDGIYRSAKRYYLNKIGMHFCVGNFRIFEFGSNVLRQLIQSTFLTHFPQNSS